VAISTTPPPVLQCFLTGLGRDPDRQWHHHRFHEIVHCVHGWGVQCAGENRWPVQAGDMFFLPAEVSHAAAAETDEGCILNVLYVRRDAFQHASEHGVAAAVLRHLRRRAETGDCRIPLTAESQGPLRSVFGSLIEEDKARQSGYALAMSLLMEQMMLVVMRDANLRPAFAEHLAEAEEGGRIDRVRAYIDTHFTQSLSVEEMASLASLGRSQFHAAFKQATGRTLVEYVQSVRVERARELLAGGGLSILDVAMRCGFGNLSHFYHVFKAHTGQTPGQCAGESETDSA
jgi:AraC family L-rhamnose operon transcriptional activator RhaR/AraC family L-rhamnose operon regulatory protein RhaS